MGAASINSLVHLDDEVTLDPSGHASLLQYGHHLPSLLHAMHVLFSMSEDLTILSHMSIAELEERVGERESGRVKGKVGGREQHSHTLSHPHNPIIIMFLYKSCDQVTTPPPNLAVLGGSDKLPSLWKYL